MSITTIIIAVIALIVLIILIAIFTGRLTLWGSGLDDASTGDDCPYTPKPACEPGKETAIVGYFPDMPTGYSCCKPTQNNPFGDFERPISDGRALA